MSRALFRAVAPLGALALAALVTAGHPLAQATTPSAPAPATAPAAQAPAAPGAPAAGKRAAVAKPAAAAAAAAPAAPSFEAAIANLKFREIGPAAMGGRDG